MVRGSPEGTQLENRRAEIQAHGVHLYHLGDK